jgi:hypothetical protein
MCTLNIKRTIKLLLLFSVLLLSLLAVTFNVKPVFASYQQTLYVTSFTAESNQWYKIGASPYLTSQDGYYVWTSVNNAVDANYTFSDIDSSGKTLVSVQYRAYIRLNTGADYPPERECRIYFYWWNGSSYVTSDYYGVGGSSYDTGWFWTDWATLSEFDTWNEINNAQLKLVSYIKSGSETVYVDCVELRVIYDKAYAWYNVETWFVKLGTKIWSTVETWNTVLGTKIWFNAEVWSFILNLGEQYSVSLMRYGLFFTGLLCIGFSLIGGVKKHDSMGLAIFWILVFFIGIGLLIAVGGMW